MCFVANLVLFTSVKEFWKSINIGPSYVEKYGVLFLTQSVQISWSNWFSNKTTDKPFFILNLRYSIWLQIQCTVWCLAQLKRAHVTSYWRSIVTMALYLVSVLQYSMSKNMWMRHLGQRSLKVIEKVWQCNILDMGFLQVFYSKVVRHNVLLQSATTSLSATVSEIFHVEISYPHVFHQVQNFDVGMGAASTRAAVGTYPAPCKGARMRKGSKYIVHSLPQITQPCTWDWSRPTLVLLANGGVMFAEQNRRIAN